MATKMQTKSLIISPINQSTSMHDYRVQLTRAEKGNRMIWDDSYKNKAIRGDYFAFTHYGKKVDFYEIVEILSSVHRLKEWMPRNRQVIVLGPCIRSISWTEWINMGGHKRPNGTTHLKDGLRTSKQFIKMLDEKMSAEFNCFIDMFSKLAIE